MTRLFDLLARRPLLACLLLLAAQTILGIGARDLWFSDEIRHANVFEHLLSGKWIVLYLNGEPYPDKPPLYFWFLRVLYGFWPTLTPGLFHLAAALQGGMFLAACLWFCRAVLGFTNRRTLLAGLVLLGNIFFVGITHYARMDLLFATAITASQVLLFKGYLEERRSALVLWGFGLAGLAILIKGPLGGVLPLVSVVAFLFVSGRPLRLMKRDTLYGLLLCLAFPALWIATSYLLGETAFVENLFTKQLYKRAVDASHHNMPWYFYGYILPLICLPWTLLLPALPFWRLGMPNFWAARVRNIRDGAPGPVFTWAALISGILFLSAISTKLVVYPLPLLPMLAGVAVLGLERLSGKGMAVLFGFLALLLAVLGVGPALAQAFSLMPVPLAGSWYVLAAGLVASVGFLLLAPRREITGLVLAFVLGFTLLLAPLTTRTAPALDAMMSPKAQADVLADYIKRGYSPLVYKIYDATYTYHVGRALAAPPATASIPETNELPDVRAFLAAHPRTILAIREKYWNEWQDRPANLQVIHRHLLVDRWFLLVASD